jgi:hypothetical protein
MKKTKIILALVLILLISTFLSGCYVFDSLSDMLCCDAIFFPLPIAAIFIKLLE